MTQNLVSDALDRLFDAVCGSETAPDPDERAALRATYAILREGDPVTPPRLATAMGWRAARAKALLERLPNVERDDRDRVIGFGGLTLHPTPHKIIVDGQLRYAWCAWDTLFLPVALDRVIDVSSRCAHTAQPVTLTVAPTGILHRRPPGVVLSFLQPEAIDPADLRSSFCGEVRFLAEAAAAERWRAQAFGRLVLDLDDAFGLGQRLILRRCGPC